MPSVCEIKQKRVRDTRERDLQVPALWASHSNPGRRQRTFNAEGPAHAKTKRKLGVVEELEGKGVGNREVSSG